MGFHLISTGAYDEGYFGLLWSANVSVYDYEYVSYCWLISYDMQRSFTVTKINYANFEEGSKYWRFRSKANSIILILILANNKPSIFRDKIKIWEKVWKSTWFLYSVRTKHHHHLLLPLSCPGPQYPSSIIFVKTNNYANLLIKGLSQF